MEASSPERHVRLSLDPARLARWLTIGAAVLVGLGGLAIVSRFGFGHDHVYGLVPKFDLDRELNVPTWYSSVLLLVAGLLLAAVAAGRRAAGDRFARHWTGLAVIFVLLSLDEAASLHGLPSRPLREALDLPGFLYYAWVIPMAAALLVFGAAYARFTWALPPVTRRLFVLAGVIYVGGALGGEVATGAYRTVHGIDGLYATLALFEEALEMGGAILFIYAIADYLARHHGVVRLTIGGTPDAPAELALPAPAVRAVERHRQRVR